MNHKNPFSHLDCNFHIRESKRAKRISLRIKAPKTVTLVVPTNSSIKKGIEFAIEHEKWVTEQLIKAEAKTKTSLVTITPQSNFSTKQHQFIFKPHQNEKAFIRLHSEETHLHYPDYWTDNSSMLQDLISIALRETYRKEAKAYLPTRINTLAKEHGFTLGKVSIRDSKGRWGSCSIQKNISLSLSLLKLPYPLIDYILLHELCHTVEMNHGKHFHTLLDKVCNGQSKALNKEVKKYSIR